MTQLIRYVYGDYTHEPGEVVDMKWEELPNHTRRGWRDTVLKRCTLYVQLQGCDWATLKAKIDAMNEAYSVNEKLFVILDENGEATRHVLNPDDTNSIRGPRVCAVELPTAQMEQMVIQRDYVITLEMLYEACENEIIEYTETITNIGRCGRVWQAQNVVTGSPRVYEVWPSSMETIIQEGHAIGFHGWYTAGATPTPMIDTVWEHEEKRVIEPVSPLHYGYSWLYYGLRWRFEFQTPSPVIAIPQYNQPIYTNGYFVPRYWVPSISTYS